MRNLPEPSRDRDRDDLKKAVRQYTYGGEIRGHAITTTEIDAVVALYDRYETNRGRPCDDLKGNGFPASLSATIHAAYDKTQEGRTLHPLRQALFEGVDLCPICGIGPPTELDHYLPRSAFKPLAIHARNLVPICHPCNHAKLAGFDDGEAAFLHPYYDILPDLDFLRASVDLSEGALVASFSIDAAVALPPGYGERLTGQMIALNLDERYQQEVNTYVWSHAAALHIAHGGAGQAGVRNLLRMQAAFEIEAFHRNHWRPTLLQALERNDDFTAGAFVEILPMPIGFVADVEA